MQRDELRTMLKCQTAPGIPSVADLCLLWLKGSPLLHGGTVTTEAIIQGMEKLHLKPTGPNGEITQEDADALMEAIRQPFRALEIIQPPRQRGKRPLQNRPKIPAWSAEWLADVIASVTAVLPSATAEQILWEFPATLVFHLVAANVRKNGGDTRRPDSHASIVEALKTIGAGNKEHQTASDTEA